MSVFVIPDTADKLGSNIWLEKFNQSIRWAKKVVDSGIKLPEASGGILDMYQDTVNEARQAKDIYDKAVEQGKDVKQKIDTVRATLSWAQDTVNKTIETANTVIETWKEIQNKIGEVKDSLNDVTKLWNSIGWLVSTWSTK